MFLGFGGLLNVIGAVPRADVGLVGGQMGIQLNRHIDQTHKNAIKGKQKLPAYTSAGEVLEQARKTSEAEANATLLAKLKVARLRELKAHAEAYKHQAEYARGVAEIADDLSGVDASYLKAAMRSQLNQAEDRQAVSGYDAAFARGKSLFA